MPHLSGLNLVHPINSDKKFTISILIGTDHYWKFVQDTIARGEDPTAQESNYAVSYQGHYQAHSHKQ